jgi:catechol 2,3-dioxygenase-like lactoylglutathione lyase family enzyme
MKLDHVDLPIKDIASVRAFLERHFGFRCIFTREDGLCVLLDEDGFAITLSVPSANEVPQYPAGFHVGFNADNQDELYEMHGRLVAAGVPIVRPVGDLAGALTFHCLAPENLLVEVAFRTRD